LFNFKLRDFTSPYVYPVLAFGGSDTNMALPSGISPFDVLDTFTYNLLNPYEATQPFAVLAFMASITVPWFDAPHAFHVNDAAFD
jgi:hypothetical protein